MSGINETDVRRAVAAALGAIVSVRRPLPHQVPPAGDWYGWLLLAGRGAGKTEACARYVTEHVRGPACLSGPTPHWIGIIAPTLGDAVTACVNGPSGIKQYDPSVKLAQTSGGTVVRWANGSEAKLFGAQGPEDIERLRAGGNRCVFWLEELAAWRYLDAAWDQMRFGLRVGPRPRWIASTTPKPRHLIKRLDRGEIPNVRRTHATMFDNPYLPQEIRDALLDAYGGKTLGQQELYAKIIEQDEDALWQRKWIDDNRVKTSEVPDLRRVTVGVDPSGGAGEQGIVVVGKSIEWTDVPAANGQVVRKSAAQGWTLDDRTVRQSPAGWGKRAVEAAVEWDADDIVVETNFGGDMAVATIVGAAEALGVQIPVKKVRASRGKRPRAEPVAALAQRNEWHHVGVFEALEDQLCTWTVDTDYSPDRLDAMVWAGWHLRLAATLGLVTSQFPGSQLARTRIS